MRLGKIQKIIQHDSHTRTITLRDKYAMSAMPQLSFQSSVTEADLKRVSELAYQYADAMMEARKND